MFSQAAAFINYTNRNLFLTGKAGTGKTTFLRYIKENSSKKLAVIAPTGVAAINAGGTTIHAFFLLPWATFVPANTLMADVSGLDKQVFSRSQLKAKLKLGKQKLTLIRELELLIIDEISMVRADLLDAVDFILKTVRHNFAQPFGGVQMLFIGDMMQLPPVLKNEEEVLLKPYYNSPYFFDAHVIRDARMLYIELKKVFRQSNEDFIGLLNKIRHKTFTENDLAQLNSYYRPNFKPCPQDGYITLTSHNYLAERINKNELDRLKEKLHIFEAEISRDFPERMYPTEKTLYLKKGSQVMFIKNDKGEERRYYNGKIGIIEDFLDDEIKIIFKNEKQPLLLKKEEWQNIKYNYNTESDSIEEEELGTFSQYPIRLAWAITIHKSQGLTFEHAIIDAGASFASGQVYVALSRLSSLDGLVLLSRISSSSITIDEKVVDFSCQDHEEENLSSILENEQMEFIHNQVLKVFDWSKAYIMLSEYVNDKKSDLFEDENQDLLGQVEASVKKLAAQKEIADKFSVQLQCILPQSPSKTCDYELLHNRVSLASTWFSDALCNDVIKPLQELLIQLKSKSRTKKKQKEVFELLVFFERKKNQLAQVAQICSRLMQPFSLGDVLGILTEKKETAQVAEVLKPASKPAKGETMRISLQMFQDGKSVEEIAIDRGFAVNTIQGHLLSFIPTGEMQVENFVSQEKMQVILDFYKNNPDVKGLSEVKDALGEDISYVEIRATRIWKDHNA